MQRRYFSGDWKPSELDGGQFCEAVARAPRKASSRPHFSTCAGVGNPAARERAREEYHAARSQSASFA